MGQELSQEEPLSAPPGAPERKHSLDAELELCSGRKRSLDSELELCGGRKRSLDSELELVGGRKRSLDSELDLFRSKKLKLEGKSVLTNRSPDLKRLSEWNSDEEKSGSSSPLSASSSPLSASSSPLSASSSPLSASPASTFSRDSSPVSDDLSCDREDVAEDSGQLLRQQLNASITRVQDVQDRDGVAGSRCCSARGDAGGFGTLLDKALPSLLCSDTSTAYRSEFNILYYLHQRNDNLACGGLCACGRGEEPILASLLAPRARREEPESEEEDPDRPDTPTWLSLYEQNADPGLIAVFAEKCRKTPKKREKKPRRDVSNSLLEKSLKSFQQSSAQNFTSNNPNGLNTSSNGGNTTAQSPRTSVKQTSQTLNSNAQNTSPVQRIRASVESTVNRTVMERSSAQGSFEPVSTAGRPTISTWSCSRTPELRTSTSTGAVHNNASTSTVTTTRAGMTCPTKAGSPASTVLTSTGDAGPGPGPGPGPAVDGMDCSSHLDDSDCMAEDLSSRSQDSRSSNEGSRSWSEGSRPLGRHEEIGPPPGLIKVESPPGLPSPPPLIDMSMSTAPSPTPYTPNRPSPSPFNPTFTPHRPSPSYTPNLPPTRPSPAQYTPNLHPNRPAPTPDQNYQHYKSFQTFVKPQDVYYSYPYYEQQSFLPSQNAPLMGCQRRKANPPKRVGYYSVAEDQGYGASLPAAPPRGPRQYYPSYRYTPDTMDLPCY